MDKTLNKDFSIKLYMRPERLYVYEKIDKTIMVAEGFWRGRHWVIGKNHFCEPVVYIQWTGKNPPGDEYFGKAYWLPEDQQDDTMYYGWDHGHVWDYSPTDISLHGKPIIVDDEHHIWSIEEMLMEIAEESARLDRYEYDEAFNEE